MIKLEHTVLSSPEQMQLVIEGMRNPMNSWDKSDSGYNMLRYDVNGLQIGKNDYSLMNKLAKAGTDHRKFMRMMPVYVRITAPLYWWKEFDTYKVGTVANSCSTMHKIQEKEFTFDDFSIEHLSILGRNLMFQICNVLNRNRELFLETKDKAYWWQMIQLLPSSYNQTRNVMLNYEVLANMYHSRKNHKLDEWKDFCKWVEELPMSDLITNNMSKASELDNEKEDNE